MDGSEQRQRWMRGRVMRGGWAWSAVLAVVFAPGCAAKAGEPSAAEPVLSSAGATSAAQPSATGGVLDGVRACDLLTASEANKIGVVGPGEDSGSLAGSGTNRCAWDKPFSGGAGGFAVSIVVRPAQGIDVVVHEPGVTKEEGNFQGRMAVQLKGEPGGTSKGQCMVALAVGSASRVDVGATAGTDTELACNTVNSVATIIEPKLPKE